MDTNFNEDDFTRRFLRKTWENRKSFFLKEDFETAEGPTGNQPDEQSQTEQKNEVVIDTNDEKLTEFKKNITQFVGALKVDNKAEIVYPNDSDVVFNGVITDMNNLKFQFRYNDQSGGLYIWTDSMLLTKEVSDKLAKLVVIRDQWKDYWTSAIGQYTQQK